LLVVLLGAARGKASAHWRRPWGHALLLRLEGGLLHLLLLLLWRHAVLPLLHVHRRKGVLLQLLLLRRHHRLHALLLRHDLLLRLLLGRGWWQHPLAVHWLRLMLMLHPSCPLHGTHWARRRRRSSWRLWYLLRLLLWLPATLL
jgi:hypothetical protein